jgi:hypothetical protein
MAGSKKLTSQRSKANTGGTFVEDITGNRRLGTVRPVMTLVTKNERPNAVAVTGIALRADSKVDQVAVTTCP